MNTVKEQWRALGVLLLVIVAAFSPLVAGQFFSTGDMRDVFIPLELFFQREFLAGRIPAWNPDIAWGFPVLASAQLGFFYPPLLFARWLPITVYLPFMLIAHLVALSWGMYRLLRHLSVSNKAALFGSLAFSLSSFVMQHLTHLNIVLAIAWLPWQLIAVRATALKNQLKASDVGKLALILGIPFLIGHIQLPFMIALMSSVFFLYTRWRTTGFSYRSLVFISAVGIVAACIASVQLLPTLELAQYSSRGSGGDFDSIRANQHSFPLYHLPTILFPRFFGHDDTYWGKRLEIEYGVFIGTLPLLLVAFALFRKKLREPFWVAVAIVSFLLALGSLSPFRLVGIEPSLWFFSAPARWLLFTAFAISVLAARSYDVFFQNPADAWRFLKNTALIFTTIMILANIALLAKPTLVSHALNGALNYLPADSISKPPDYYAEKIAGLIHSMAGSTVSLKSVYSWLPLIALLLSLLLLRRPKWLIAITAAELVVIAATTSPLAPWQDILSPPATLLHLPPSVQTRQARIISLDTEGDTGAFLTNPASRANASTRQTQKELLIPLLHSQFGIAGATWPASLDMQAHEKVLQRLRPRTSELNRGLAEELNIGAVLIPNTLSSTVSIDTLHPNTRAAFYASEDTAAQIPVPYSSAYPAQASFTVDAPAPGYLVIRDSWYPGWKATVDGMSAPVERYQEIFRQIAVPTGHHIVEIKYQPLLLKTGMALSVITILMCAMVMYKPYRLL